MAQTRTRPEPKAAPLPPASDQTIQEGTDLTAEQVAAAEAQAETAAGADEGPPQPPRQTTRHYATGRRQPKTIDDQTKLFDYILELSEEEFANNFKAYIYRTEPFTQTQAQEFKYVTRYDQKFDVEVMKRELGSGRYYIRLNHSTSVGVGQSRQILAESIAIEDPQHPPNIPAGPWLDDPRNKKWAQWFRAKNQADAGATAQATAQANAQSPREMVGALKDLIQMMRPNDSANAQQNTVSAVIEAMKTSHNEAFQMFKSQGEAADPSKMFTLLTAILDRVAPTSKEGDTMTAYLLEEMRALRQQNTDLLTQMLNQNKTERSPFASLTEALGMVTTLQETIGTPKASGFDWKQVLSEAGLRLIDKVGPVLPAMLMNSQAPPPMLHTPPRPPGQAQPQAYAPPLAQATAQATTEAQTQQPTQEETTNMMLMYRQLIMQIAPAMITKLNAGAPGTEFADWFIEGYGQLAYQQVKATGEENILAAIQSVPELWSQLAPVEVTFRQFMSEFFQWEPEQFEEPTTNPDPEPKKQTKKKGAIQ